MQSYTRASFVAGVVLAVLSLAACELSTPSQIHTGKIRVTNQIVAETLDAKRIDAGRINVIADNFVQNGRGDMVLTVSYLNDDPKRAVEAAIQGNDYKAAFAKRGVSNISVETVGVQDRQYAGQVVATYPALVALPPKDCGRIPGYMGADDLEAGDNYKFGCETKAMLSKMVSNPSDLLGRAGTQDNDSRRSGILAEPYKAGTPNKPMTGFQASSIGSNSGSGG